MQHLFSHLDRRMNMRDVIPHPKAAIRYFDYFMYIMALVSPAVLLPQVMQIFWERDVAGLSVPTWFLLAIINLLWAGYGAVHKQWPLLIANFLIGSLDLVIVVGIYMYR